MKSKIKMALVATFIKSFAPLVLMLGVFIFMAWSIPSSILFPALGAALYLAVTWHIRREKAAEKEALEFLSEQVPISYREDCPRFWDSLVRILPEGWTRPYLYFLNEEENAAGVCVRFNKDKWAVGLSRQLLDAEDGDIDGVLAHELAHMALRHTFWKRIPRFVQLFFKAVPFGLLLATAMALILNGFSTSLLQPLFLSLWTFFVGLVTIPSLVSFFVAKKEEEADLKSCLILGPEAVFAHWERFAKEELIIKQCMKENGPCTCVIGSRVTPQAVALRKFAWIGEGLNERKGEKSAA